MSKPIIEIENLGKRYRIGAHKEKYLSLRDEMARWVSSAIRRKRAAQSEFWALRDVSFSVETGETVGIIGKNGAGKSTLLKLLSKITPPTTGRIIRRGRVASLLEVGTGFHPELTGRENIYLNGAILGMSRRETARKFDEIVAFSEVEKFLDTPVKRYSSGMYVRLAFAVAAHLEPEILLVDEVLAVGDVEFQRKCLGKMNDVATAGRTVLFVSHNMSAVSQLCKRGIILVEGGVACDGPVEDALARYTQGGFDRGGDAIVRPEPVTPDNDDQEAVITRVSLTGPLGQVSDSFFIGESMTVGIEVHFFKPVQEFQVSFIVRSALGSAIYHCLSRDQTSKLFPACGERATVSATFPTMKLYPGRYVIDDVWLATRNKTLDCVENCLAFHVPETGPHVPRVLSTNKGMIYETPNWEIST